jgi:hypothetical protein
MSVMKSIVGYNASNFLVTLCHGSVGKSPASHRQRLVLPALFYVGFMVDKAAMSQVFFRLLSFTVLMILYFLLVTDGVITTLR